MDPLSTADPYLADYKSKAEQAAKMTSEAMTLPDLLKKALDEKLASGPLVEERSKAAGGFLSE